EAGSVSRATILRAPNCRHEAQFLQTEAGFGVHRLSQLVTVERAGAVTLSIYYRSGGQDSLALESASESTRTRQLVRYQGLEAPVIVNDGGLRVRARAVDAGHGWARYSATVDLP